MLAALLLLDAVPVSQPFRVGGFNSINLRLWTPTEARARMHRTQPFPFPAAAAAAAGGDGGDHGDVIAGSNQLEGWKTNTIGAAGARRSNVMGRMAVPDGSDGSSRGSSGDAAGSAPPQPLLEREGGGVVRGDAGESAGGGGEVSAWRAEAATTSAELLASLKVCE